MALEPAAPVTAPPVALDSPPSEGEVKLLSQLRDRFAGEFAARESTGRLFPAFFGDLALVRVLRQHCSDLENSCRWFENFLAEFQNFDGDGIVPALAELFERIRSQGRDVQSSDIPGYSKVKDLCTVFFTVEERTLRGDPVSYIPLAELDKAGIVEAGFEHYEHFVLSGWVMRALELDDLSRHQGRLCRVFNVMDVHGVGLSNVACREFDRRAEKMMLRLERLVPDLTGSNWVINAPWFLHKLFPWAKSVLRIKVDNWFICGQEMPQELLRDLSAEELARLQAMRRAAPSAAEVSGNLSIGRGKLLERVVQVSAGQRVSWCFQVAPGNANIRPPELDFCVVAVWDDEAEAAGIRGAAMAMANSPAAGKGNPRSRGAVQLEDSGLVDLVGEEEEEDDDDWAQLPEHEVIETVRYNASQGKVAGHYVAGKAGVLSLRWSNSFGWLRAKTLRLELNESAGEGGEAESGIEPTEQ